MPSQRSKTHGYLLVCAECTCCCTLADLWPARVVTNAASAVVSRKYSGKIALHAGEEKKRIWSVFQDATTTTATGHPKLYTARSIKS